MKALKIIFAVLAMTVTAPAFAQFTTGGNNRSFNRNSELTLQPGYRGFVDLGYGIGVGDCGEGRVEVSTTHGYQILPYFYIGAGIGVNYYHEGDVVNIPIFADFRGSLPIQNTKVAPFVDMKFGYSVNDIEGFYFAPSVGVRIATSEKCGVNVGLGYEMQKFDFDLGYYGTWTENTGAFTIKLGFDF